MSLEEEARDSLEAKRETKRRAEEAAAHAASPKVRKAEQLEALGGRGSELVALLHRSKIRPVTLSAHGRDRKLLTDTSQGWILSSAAGHYGDESGTHWSSGFVIGTDGVIYVYSVDRYSALSALRLRRLVTGVATAEPRFLIESAEAVIAGKFDHADKNEYRWLFAGKLATLVFLLIMAFGIVSCIAYFYF